MSRRLFKALDEAIAHLSRLLQTEGTGLVHDRRLRKALKELKIYRKGGVQPPQRLYLAVEMVCEVLCELSKRAK